jgi:hypothetical protein
MSKKPFVLSGKINARYLKNKRFKTEKDALSYMDSLITKYDLDVTDANSYNNVQVYFVDSYTVFTISEQN